MEGRRKKEGKKENEVAGRARTGQGPFQQGKKGGREGKGGKAKKSAVTAGKGSQKAEEERKEKKGTTLTRQ